MTRIALAVRALYRGSQLAKVETWKKASVATTALTGLLSALVGLAVTVGWLERVDPQLIMEISSALVTLVTLVLGYFQIATTDKIGLTDPRRRAQPERLPEHPDKRLPPAADDPSEHSSYSAHDDAFGPWHDPD